MARDNEYNDDDKSTIGEIKRGALHEQLGYPQDVTIPGGVLDRILKANVGTTILVNGKHLTVTPKLQKRAQFAKNFGKK